MISNGRESPQGEERGPWVAWLACKSTNRATALGNFFRLSVWSLRPCVTGSQSFDFCNLSVQAFVRAKRPEPAGSERKVKVEGGFVARAHESRNTIDFTGERWYGFSEKRATALRALSSSRGAVRVSGRCMLAKPKASDLFQSGRLLLVMLITWMLIDAYLPVGACP
jgi:hypothetical protein